MFPRMEPDAMILTEKVTEFYWVPFHRNLTKKEG